MITFTEMKNMAAELCGIDPTSPQMAKVTADINTGIKRFQNASRRYWTRREKKTSIKANQQYYQFPEDMLRVSTVKVRIDDKDYPLKEIHSEEEWNKINLVQSFASNIPIYYFIRGDDEIGIYPIPAEDNDDALRVSYEPRMPDLNIDDFEVSVNVEQNSTSVERVQSDPDQPAFTPELLNNCYLKVSTPGNDGRWYKISGFIDADTIQLENYFQGLTQTGATATIGQAPPFPEEYHIAPIYYACQQFYLIRKDNDSSSLYAALFDKNFNEYKQVYGIKTTGGVINPSKTRLPNIFNLPPNVLTE